MSIASTGSPNAQDPARVFRVSFIIALAMMISSLESSVAITQDWKVCLPIETHFVLWFFLEPNFSIHITNDGTREHEWAKAGDALCGLPMYASGSATGTLRLGRHLFLCPLASLFHTSLQLHGSISFKYLISITKLSFRDFLPLYYGTGTSLQWNSGKTDFAILRQKIHGVVRKISYDKHNCMLNWRFRCIKVC